MSEAQKIIDFIDDVVRDDYNTWNFIRECSDDTGDGDYCSPAAMGDIAREIFEEESPDRPTFEELHVDPDKVDWLEVGNWLFNSFTDADGDDE